MAIQGRGGRFISRDERRLNEGIARGILIEESPNAGCRVGKVRLKNAVEPPAYTPYAKRDPVGAAAATAALARCGIGDRPYERDDPPPAMEAAIVKLQAQAADKAPARTQIGQPTAAPSPSNPALAGKVASCIAWGVLIACLAFWVPFLASFGFGAGIQTYLAKGSPFIARQLARGG